MAEQVRTLRQTVDRVREILKPDYDWNAHFEQDEYDDPKDLFRTCILVENCASSEEAKKYISCGSAAIQDTPASLYRILYLCKPKTLDFSDMYKNSLLSFFSQDRRFLVDVGFYKYKLDLRFYALRELVDTSEMTHIYCGVPGFDNGDHLNNEDGIAFFEMIKEALNYTWMVYGGNNFEV